MQQLHWQEAPIAFLHQRLVACHASERSAIPKLEDLYLFRQQEPGDRPPVEAGAAMLQLIAEQQFPTFALAFYEPLQAAGNGAFLAAGPGIWRAVSGGETLTDALSRSGLFTTEFLQIVATAEESGTVPEQLDRLSRLFHDEARRSMTRLTKALSGLVWFLTAGLIVYFIFRIAMIYVGILNDAVGMAG